MSNYELLYLISSNKSKEEIKNIINKVEEILNKYQIEIANHGIWSRRQLAYKIKGVEHGFYILALFKTEPKNIQKIKQDLLIKKDILRYIIVKHNNLKQQTKVFVEKQEIPERGNTAKKEKTKLPKTESIPQVTVSEEIKTQDKKESKSETPKTDETEKKKEKKPEPEKSSLEDLDKKLEDIIDGEIEL